MTNANPSSLSAADIALYNNFFRAVTDRSDVIWNAAVPDSKQRLDAMTLMLLDDERMRDDIISGVLLASSMRCALMNTCRDGRIPLTEQRITDVARNIYGDTKVAQNVIDELIPIYRETTAAQSAPAAP